MIFEVVALGQSFPMAPLATEILFATLPIPYASDIGGWYPTRGLCKNS